MMANDKTPDGASLSGLPVTSPCRPDKAKPPSGTTFATHL
ncbi:hypothetical protein HMPREF0208_01363 [Citrobacter koseri]|nr:hypothetical protein HMPREF0208_01363 [Citrobacter koseri]